MRRIENNDAGYVWKQVPYKPISMLSTRVTAFAEAMERKERGYDHKGPWDHSDVEWLMTRLEDEMAEFQRAVDSRIIPDLLSQAAYVANYLKMICETLGALDEKIEGQLIIFDEKTGQLITEPKGEGDVT